MRQLRLRDIGGIIVIDFIDMANPKNRATVEEALRSELERDRTKTYVVEISPLGLVEMTRQNVTDGPREIMTRKCPTCGGDGIVYSEASAAIDVERRLRALAAGSRSQAFRVELADSIASALVGPGARRLLELEALTKKQFFLEGKPETHLDHFVVLARASSPTSRRSPRWRRAPSSMLELVEVDRYDSAAAVGKLDGLEVVVADAATLVGKRLKVRIERVLDGRAYAVAHPQDEGGARAADGGGRGREADPQAARSGRARRSREGGKPRGEEETSPPRPSEAEAESRAEASAEDEDEGEERGSAEGEEPKPKKKTRRGSRGGRNARRSRRPRRRKRRSSRAEEERQATRRGVARAAASRHDPRPGRGSRPRREAEPASRGRPQRNADGAASGRACRGGRRGRRGSAEAEEEDAARLARRPQRKKKPAAASRTAPRQRRAEQGRRSRQPRGRGPPQRGAVDERRLRVRPDVRVGRRDRDQSLATLPTRGRQARVSTP